MWIDRVKTVLRGRDGRVYILPTAGGIVFLAALALFVTGAFAFDNDYVFAVAFLLSGTFLAGMFATHFNLDGIRVISVAATSADVGGFAEITVVFANPSRRARRALSIRLGGADDAPLETLELLPARGKASILFRVSLPVRGIFTVPDLRVTTVYPLALFASWMRLSGSGTYCAYPRPIGAQRFPGGGDDGGKRRAADDDDFYGHRDYQPGDSLRRIDWNKRAQGRALVTRVFAREAAVKFVFSLRDAPGDIERQLSQLALWLREAFRARRAFGLDLPGISIPAASGREHLRRCLRCLAGFGGDS